MFRDGGCPLLLVDELEAAGLAEELQAAIPIEATTIIREERPAIRTGLRV